MARNDTLTDRGGEATTDDQSVTTDRTVLELDDVTKRFADEAAVEGFSLSVRDGELLTLLGPSGCGKTTTLRLIGGLTDPTEGTVSIDGEVIAGEGRSTPPEQRDVGLVFQNFALFSHLSVERNIAFGITDWPADQREARVDELLELVDLTGHREKMPSQLSGGQKQRVALARSLAPEPEVLLLDEPFSNLDVRLRVEMREEVRRILKTSGVTAVSVTHDQEEALSISDRVAIVNDGTIEQVGKPEAVFENPESRFVASFLGRASFLTGRVRGTTVETPLGTLSSDRLNGPIDAYDGAQIDILVRPDDVVAQSTTADGADGSVVHRQYNGPNFVYRVDLDEAGVVRCRHNHAETFEHGQPVVVSIDADHPLAWYPVN